MSQCDFNDPAYESDEYYDEMGRKVREFDYSVESEPSFVKKGEPVQDIVRPGSSGISAQGRLTSKHIDFAADDPDCGNFSPVVIKKEVVEVKQPSIQQHVKDEPKRRVKFIKQTPRVGGLFSESAASTHRIDEALMYMIVVDSMSLQVVESRAFLRFMKIVAPSYTVPCLRKLTKMLDDKFGRLSAIIRVKIGNASFYSLTADVWTDTGNAKSYLGMTIHLLDGINMIGVALAAQPLDDCYTKDYLISEMTNICSSWGVDLTKVNVIVTGGSNIVAAAESLFGVKKHLICLEQSLNRMTTAAIDQCHSFGEILSKIRSIVSFFKLSNNATDELRSIQIRAGKTEGEIMTVEIDEPTRWGTTLTMLHRFILLADHISVVLLRYTKVPMLTGQEMAEAKEARDIFGCISLVISEIKGEKCSISGKVIPMLNIMKRKLESYRPDCPAVSDLRQKILLQFANKFSDVDKLDTLTIATMLDPRFKTMYLEKMVQERTTKMVSDLILGKECDPVDVKPKVTPIIESDDIWDFHDQLVQQSSTRSDSQRSVGISAELRDFLQQPIVQRTADPIQAWESIRNEYPQLYPVAVNYLSRMVTSVPSERLFSSETSETTANRHTFDPHLMAKLAFLGSLSEDYWDK
ncbi:E3 SUMO-protein ligase ZBED1 [Armigeres subalbatus]|uniref:E3 SUMO-protein ligase ZBED1 n=1 Tax=Armigeres subalbatus TaxID=124917 RepID=UPI002ED3CB59